MDITDYRNFDLLITRTGEQYRAFVVDAPAGEGSTLFDLPVVAEEPVAPDTVHLADLGALLFNAVFRDKVRSLLAASLASVAEEGAGLRVRLRFEEDAAGLARVALSAAGSLEWAIPVLFSRSPDNRLFDLRQMLPTPECPYPDMVPFSEAQQELFFGREREIQEAGERLRQHPFLAVIGPSGSGQVVSTWGIADVAGLALHQKTAARMNEFNYRELIPKSALIADTVTRRCCS